LGVHALVWDEAQKLAGKDPDWLRRDLWKAIEMGQYPEFEFGVQIVEEEDEFAFDFDLLDPTKIIPEELVPVQPIGKMVLNRNPDNFFAETEQVAFHPGHVVPGIDFTNDPLLQGRLFSYLDTQLIRLGGPNFHEIPINRSVAEVHNNQRDGHHRQTINRGRTNYFPNSLGGGCPMTAPENMGGYVHYQERVEGHKVRERSPSFKNHYSQARLFWMSMTEPEKQHIVEAFHFELGKVDSQDVRQRMVDHIANIDERLAAEVSHGIGIAGPSNNARALADGMAPTSGGRRVDSSPSLSMVNTRKDTIQSRRVAILAADGVDTSVQHVKQLLEALGTTVEVVSKFKGGLQSDGGDPVEVDKNYVTTGSIMYDAVLVPGGVASVQTLKMHGEALHFINEAFKHCKTIGAIADGVELLSATELRGVRLAGANGVVSDKGVVTVGANPDLDAFVGQFGRAIAMHRHWDRESLKDQVPA
jgi:catalase